MEYNNYDFYGKAIFEHLELLESDSEKLKYLAKVLEDFKNRFDLEYEKKELESGKFDTPENEQLSSEWIIRAENLLLNRQLENRKTTLESFLFADSIKPNPHKTESFSDDIELLYSTLPNAKQITKLYLYAMYYKYINNIEYVDALNIATGIVDIGEKDIIDIQNSFKTWRNNKRGKKLESMVIDIVTNQM